DLAGLLERQREDPQRREDRPDEDQDRGRDPQHLRAGRLHQRSPRTCERSTRNPLMKIAAISTTDRNSSTPTASPSPIAVRVIVCRYVRNERVSVFCWPAVMMNTLSKIRQASRVRNSTATRIAPFMFGSVTRHIRCQAV